MRIAVLGSAAALHTRRWARALADRGAEVRIFSLEAPPVAPGAADPADPADPPCTVLSAWPLPRGLRYPAARGALARALAAFVPDLVEAHFVPNYGLLGALVERRPLVVHAWGSDLLRSPGRSPFHAARARFALTRADLVVVDARVLGEAAVALGAPAARVAVVPWGADLARFPLAPPAAAPHVVSLRQLEPLYDVACLVDALPAVRAAVPAVTVTIAGDGPQRGALERRVRARGMADRVVFAGAVPHRELPALLAGAAAVVSCARSDSTSISLLEAMASGATPVVTDLAGNREWIDDGVEGRLFPAGDPAALARALAAVLGDPGFRAVARTKARRRVEEHGDFARAVDGMLARYGTLASRGAAA
jgi:glycosyltransferase involved in cell wall biosynthesis